MKRSSGFFYLIFILAIFALPAFQGNLYGQAVFLMGEDVLHPGGLVLTVNEFRRSPFTGGLGGQGKQDEIRVNLTLVNTGMVTFRVDPARDFQLELSRRFDIADDPEGRSEKMPFNIFPSTQSRIDLFFRVPAADKLQPLLVFNLQESEVKVLCDPELEALAQRSLTGSISTREAVELARFYVDFGHFSAAEKIVEKALQADSSNNQLWMLMAAVHEANYDNRAAAECLDRVNPSLISTYEEASSLARQALNLGHYSLSIAVLEPYESINKLDEKNQIVLARAYYYEEEYPKAEKILQRLENQNSSEAMVYFTLGNIKDKQNSVDEAIPHWEKAIELDPDYCEAYFNLGVGYYKLDKIEKARDFWQKVLFLRPDSVILRATEDALKATEY
jgi:tetratricopeptide (TPR) repeat protein